MKKVLSIISISFLGSICLLPIIISILTLNAWWMFLYVYFAIGCICLWLSSLQLIEQEKSELKETEAIHQKSNIDFCNEYPNDADLGRVVRTLYTINK